MSRKEKIEVGMQRFFRSQEYRDDIAALAEKSGRGHTYSEEYSDDQLIKLYNNITIKQKGTLK